MTSVTPWVGNTWTCSTPGREHSDSQARRHLLLVHGHRRRDGPAGRAGRREGRGRGAAAAGPGDRAHGRHRLRRRVARAREATEDRPKATNDDITWADVVLLGSPTRFGNVASQLQAFLDALGPEWGEGKLADKVYAGFTASQTDHGGQESTLLALYNDDPPLRRHRRGARLHRPHEVHRRQPVRRVPRHGPRQRRALGGRLAARTRPPRRAHPHRRRQGSPADTS